MFDKTEKYQNIFIAFYKESENNLEKVIQILKDEGATQVISILVLKSALGLSLKEADNLILNSKAWEESREFTINLREEFADALENYSHESNK